MRGRGCKRCADRRPIDYKDTAFMGRFIEPTGKLIPARKSGCSGPCQRRIALATKRARHLALLPYVAAHVRVGDWLSLLEAAGVPVWNPPALVRWNLDKRYLLELGRLGIPVVPTVALNTPSAEGGAAVMRERGWTEAVVKPAWDARGFAVGRVHLSELTEDPLGPGMLDRPLLVQEYVPAISEQGEVAFVFCGGTFSHALLKRPSAGEFRVNAQYGGSVTAMEPRTISEGLQQASSQHFLRHRCTRGSMES